MEGLDDVIAVFQCAFKRRGAITACQDHGFLIFQENDLSELLRAISIDEVQDKCFLFVLSERLRAQYIEPVFRIFLFPSLDVLFERDTFFDLIDSNGQCRRRLRSGLLAIRGTFLRIGGAIGGCHELIVLRRLGVDPPGGSGIQLETQRGAV